MKMHLLSVLLGRTIENVKEIVTVEQLVCDKTIAQEWKEELQSKLWFTGAHLELRFVDNEKVELYTDGDPEDVLDEIRVGRFDLKSFAQHH